MFPEPQFRTRVVPDFYPNANELRQKFVEFFSHPYADNENNFVLNYWHVKDLYLYLRAFPQAILGKDALADFMTALSMYTMREFGLTPRLPYLSIYINGMYQSIHSDQRNGTYGYVFSLTTPLYRFVGGETMVARPGVFDQLEPRDHRGRDSYLECFPPHFNQLLLFDDRVAHAVNPIMGTMDPREGRVVLHGHIY